MNTSTTAPTISGKWLSKGIVAASVLLVASATIVGFWFGESPIVDPTSTTRPVTTIRNMPLAAQQRYENFKLGQVERLEGAWDTTSSAAWLRYEDFKLRQIEAVDQHARRR
jgi:hypothetical protein